MKQLFNRLTRRITNAGTALRALPFVLFFWASMANNAFATDITAQFPDANFLAQVRIALGLNPGDPIEDTDNFAGVTSLSVSYSDITSLAGIEYFTALENLDCSDNSLTSLDVSGLTALQGLSCYNYSLTALDVSGLNSLVYLSCSDNSLIALNVSGLTALQWLYCYNNSLTSLDVSGLNSLQELYCSDNSLTALNVSGLTALKGLYCYNNSLTSLDVSGLTALQTLYCYNNSLTALNVSGLTLLQELDCDNNSLTALDVSGLTALTDLYCDNNSLTALDVSGLTALTNLYCENNRLTDGTLNITGCTLNNLNCSYNDMTPYAESTSIAGYSSATITTLTYDPQNASGFRPVNNITGIPQRITAGTPFALSSVAQVRPADATNQTPIVWSIFFDNGTGATLRGQTLTTTATGTLMLLATIANGMASGTPYQQAFTITAVAPLPSVGPVGSFYIAPVPDQTFTGLAIRPALTVKDGGVTLLEGVHYVTGYANNIHIGTATATVIGIGGYSGTQSLTFQIVPLPVRAFGRILIPSEGSGATPGNPYIAEATAPVNTPMLYPPDITMDNDGNAAVTLYARPDFTLPLSGVDLYMNDTAKVYVKIASLGKEYFYVVKIALPQQITPPPIGRPVTLPSVAGFTTDPSAGVHSVPSRSHFTFTLTPVVALPAGQAPSVTTNRRLIPDADGVKVTPNADGSYTVIIYRVQEPTTVSIGFTTANDAITAARVWSAGQTLYIHAPQSGTARIYGVTGQLVKTVAHTADETAQTALPRGVYIVVANGKTYKVIMEN
ncbi:MAG: hypothetical protein LBT78_08495 [Tannerella sp.]|jgi:Leucine-rich repeat (LRR) protein|nr:hypothetical protein [Tannerella sp.]